VKDFEEMEQEIRSKYPDIKTLSLWNRIKGRMCESSNFQFYKRRIRKAS
jgi:hypothetical protein